MKTILITGYFREPSTIVHPKIEFFTRLAEFMAKRGYRVEFLDFTQRPYEGELPANCAIRRFEPRIESYPSDWIGGMLGRARKGECTLALDAYRVHPKNTGARRRLRWQLLHNLGEMEKAIEALFDELEPALVINWNGYVPAHILFGEMCRRHGIPRLLAEGGIIPGTIEFEEHGHQADGFALRELNLFQQLPLSAPDLERAEAYNEHLRSRPQSKKQQQALDLSELEQRLRQTGRRLIFYGATNEFNEIRPRHSPWSRCHSPHFEGDRDAVRAILDLLEPLNAELLVKTHPNMPDEPWPEHPRLTVVHEGDMFKCLGLADLFVVNSTQISGFGALLEKPTVMLGANGMTGKGCCYELRERGELEPVLREALERGHTREMRQGWVEYMARNMTHFAYAIHPESEAWIGRGPKEAAAMIRDFIEQNRFLKTAKKAAERGARWMRVRPGARVDRLPNPGNDRRLRALKDIHRGQRAFLIGNGPSLKVEDLDKLKNEITFASNRIFLAFDQTDWRPTYFTACDRQVAKYQSDMFADLDLFKVFAHQYYERFKNDPQAVFFNPFRKDDNGEAEWDIVHGVRCGNSVITMDIKLAYWMGIREMYVIGVDHKFKEPQKRTVDPVHGHEVLVADGEQNHFHPEYRPKGETWSMPTLERSTEEFIHARQFLEGRGGKIYNASRETALEAWELVNLDDVLAGRAVVTQP